MKFLSIVLLLIAVGTASGIRLFNRILGTNRQLKRDSSIEGVQCSELLISDAYRGGYTKKTSTKKKPLTTGFMLKSFFVSLYDPTVGGLIDNGSVGHVTQAKGKGSKKSSSSFGGMFGSFGSGGSGGSFGPVCGPNGCH